MIDRDWHYFALMLFWSAVISAGVIIIISACSTQAQPTPCDRQLVNCRAEVATLTSTLAECQKK